MEMELSRALSARDVGHLVSLYADDAALYYADNPPVTGKDAIRETWEGILSKPGFSMSTEPLEVEIATRGNLAFSHGAYTTTTNNATGKTVTADKGEYAVVYRKEPDGKWKIVADNGNSDLRAHSLTKFPDRRQKPIFAIAPLIGLICFMSGLWFLFGMPVVLLVFAWKYYQSRELPTGFLVSVVMLIAFFATAGLLWRHVATHYWNLSFLTALDAARDAASYGHPVEHTAENLLANLLIFSTLSAAAGGAISGSLRYLWGRRRRLVLP